LIYRKLPGGIEVLLAHPGGPFWARKDDGAWSIPKGELSEDENPLEAAKREFNEETGFPFNGQFEALDPVKQPSGKIIYVWIAEGDIDTSMFRSNTFSMEWPRGSGNIREFPEVDRVNWFDTNTARSKIIKGQIAFLDQLKIKVM
jgi:predicted NUDIX family NTP pyrophosphohydrolase